MKGAWRILLFLLAASCAAQGPYAPPEGGFVETPRPAEPALADVGITAGGVASASFMRDALAPLFGLWRYWLTDQNASFCRYAPTCSNYAYGAVSAHGPVKGVALAFGRLLRCHNHIPPARYPVLFYDYSAVLEAYGYPHFEACGAWEPLNFTVFAREARGHLSDPVP
jgi:putative component of membrane protein insertase Oxa1/YidC/SpoIIIJ protein YidD